MEWSPKQEQALIAVADWHKNSENQVFHLFGYAGTGKTTLAKHMVEGISGRVLFGAYTGKAAHVLTTKGCPAQTIHSMIYKPKGDSDRRKRELESEIQQVTSFILDEENPEYTNKVLLNQKLEKLKELLKQEAQKKTKPFFSLNLESPVQDCALIVIDECSMVDAKMASDLLSFGVKVLVLGDPAQLPPVGGAGYFTEGVKPNIMLDEIHRQAAESPIIDLATKARNKIPIEYGEYGNCRVIEKGKLSKEEVLSFDQVLVGMNRTRNSSNKKIRSFKGLNPDYPVPGDKIVSLNNNSSLGILNGQLFHIDEILSVMDNKIQLVVRNEDGALIEVLAHEQHFLGKPEDIAWYEKKEAHEFDYGYALTCHKAQGSQWNSVMLIDESHVFKKDSHRWLYTAITRAAEQLVIVR